MKLWGGRFQKDTDAIVDDFNSSISFDKRLYKQDITGSIAHANMLGACGIISKSDADAIIEGLKNILDDIEAGNVEFDIAAEDIHMNVETLLIKKIGDVGKKLHTARSRNDQVALDLKMYCKEQINIIIDSLIKLENTLLNIAKEHKATIMPGFTHLQKAQAISLGHHILAYFQMFSRDITRLKDCYKRMDTMPLGSGALAGTTFPINRQMVADELNFTSLTLNSLDAVSDRDYVVELESAAAISMMHMSRLCEELIIWASDEYKFITMDDAYSTGSSIMPQKKNPDVAELIRGKTGRVYGNLMATLTMLKGIPLAYNKDMQEDKEAIFDTLDTWLACLDILEPMLCTMEINKANMYKSAGGGFTNATDLADYLVKKGIAFRDAHKIAGELVYKCISESKTLEQLSLEDYEATCP
ncbi:MAG: argininosuccinate lyase, partial [Christensenellaceae bacterium]|nr:argininosuccinate lyase [Christensenellaceae bacterium]